MHCQTNARATHLALLILLVSIPTIATAAVIRVDPGGGGDYLTIQAGMDAAVTGDTVLLAAGTYTDFSSQTIDGHPAKAVVFLKSGVKLEGEAGAANTILDALGGHHCLIGEDLADGTEIRGLTLLNGSSDGGGGAGNALWGGGLLAYRSSLLVDGCHFIDCRAEGGAGALFIDPSPGISETVIQNCFFDGNIAGQLGGALELFRVNFRLENNTFVRNFADDIGGGVLVNIAAGTIDRNIFWMNSSGSGGGGMNCINGSEVTGSCNVFWDNIGADPNGEACFVNIDSDGNVNADPLFCDLESNDFRIQGASPASAGNSGGCGQIGAFPTACGVVPGGNGLMIPELIAAAGTEIRIPILLEGESTSDVSSYRAELSYAPAILSFERLEVVGTLSDGLLMAGNETGLGTLLIAAAGTTPIVAPGVLVEVILSVSPGIPDGVWSPVAFESFTWDEGVPATPLQDGGVTVGDGLTVSGRVGYYSNDQPIAAVDLSLEGETSRVTDTDVGGDYTFPALWVGFDGTVTASTTSESVEVVSALDASLILQHLVELTTLDANQILAADLTEDGTASPADASAILEMVVGGPPPEPLWLFVPDVIGIDGLAASRTDADFVGLLRGDVSGNWCPDGPCSIEGRQGIAWTASGAWQNPYYELTLRLTDAGAHGVDFALDFDPAIFRLNGVETLGGGLWDWSESNGHVAVAGATALPWSADEAGATFRFASQLSPRRRSTIDIVAVRIDEGAPQGAIVQVPGILPPREEPHDFDLRLSPNPARAEVAMQIVGASGLVQVSIFDVQGRRIRSLDRQPGAAGNASFVWDRRDTTGKIVGDGIYFVRARSAENTLLRRVVLIR